MAVQGGSGLSLSSSVFGGIQLRMVGSNERNLAVLLLGVFPGLCCNSITLGLKVSPLQCTLILAANPSGPLVAHAVLSTVLL